MARRCPWLAVVLAVLSVPRGARANGVALIVEQAAPQGSPSAVGTLVVGSVVLALGAAASAAGISRSPASSLAAVVWPSLSPATGDTSDAARPPAWSVPAGARKPLFFATLIDVRF